MIWILLLFAVLAAGSAVVSHRRWVRRIKRTENTVACLNLAHRRLCGLVTTLDRRVPQRSHTPEPAAFPLERLADWSDDRRETTVFGLESYIPFDFEHDS